MRDVAACFSLVLLAPACFSPDTTPAATSDTDQSDTGTSDATSTMGSSTAMTSPTTTATDADATTGSAEPCRADDDCTEAEAAWCIEGICVSCSDTDSPHDTCAAADPLAPLCVEGSCVSCAEAASPDDACAEADPNLPACLDGQCTQCSDANDSQCGGAVPACVAGECAPCSFHFQCPDSACNLWTGECIDAVPATVGPNRDYPTLGAALASVAAGGQAVFILYDNTGGAAYVESVEVTDNRVVAVLAPNGPRPVLQGDGNHTVRVTTGATLMVERLRFAGYHPASNLVPLRVEDGKLGLDQTEVNDNRGAVVLLQGSSAIVRNTTVALEYTSTPAIRVSASELQMTYSTLAAAGTGVGVGDNVPAGIVCQGDAELDVRNSIIVNVHADTPSLHNCNGQNVSVSYTATREQFPGTGNMVVGPLVTHWFVDFPANTRLSTAGGTPGNAVFEDIAQWTLGEPPFDIDGSARPNTDGAADHAGAHKP